MKKCKEMTVVLCIFTAYLNRYWADLKRSGVDCDCRCRRGDRLAVVHPLDGRQREPGSRTGQLEFGSLRNRFVEVRPAAEFRRNENRDDGLTDVPSFKGSVFKIKVFLLIPCTST